MFLAPLLIVAGVGDLVVKFLSLLALIPASVIPSLMHLRFRTTSIRQLTTVTMSGVVCAPIGGIWAQYLSPLASSLTIAVLAIVFAVVAIGRVFLRLRRS